MNTLQQSEFPTLLVYPEEDRRIDEFLKFLRGWDWITARQVKQVFAWDERTCRKLAELSQGEILSGQKGYKLTREATADERDHAVNWLRSQGNKMIGRALKISRVHHTNNPPSSPHLLTVINTCMLVPSRLLCSYQ